MSILLTNKTRVVIQGITGQEGSRAAHDMIEYGTAVVAGVTPGKGGQRVDGVRVFDSLAQAQATCGAFDASFIAVPAPFVRDAALEAINAAIGLIVILTEYVPVHDVAALIAAGRDSASRIIGPSSVGIMSPGKAKIGSIGSSDLAQRLFRPGPVGLMSKSGGMTAELSRILTDAGIGQSTVIGIGGDVLVGSDFADLAQLFEHDSQTKAIVIFGEVGGVYEEKLAQAMAAGEVTKPVIALIAGDFGHRLVEGTVLGHAGAIVTGRRGSAASKKRALKAAGALIARNPEEVPDLVQQALA